MAKCLPKNLILFTGFKIAVQVILILSFIILFFVLFTKSMEIKSFKHQTNFIIDDIVDDIVDDIMYIVDDGKKLFLTPMDKKTVISGIDGVLEYNRTKIDQEERSHTDKVNKQNKKVMLTAILIVVGLVIMLGIVTLILTKRGHCLPFRKNLLEAGLIVLMIALIEMFFLTFIAQKYISVKNVTIRKHLGGAISKYAKSR